jgi:hypothetical protein
LAEEDRHTDTVGERTSEFISQSTRELIDDLEEVVRQKVTSEGAHLTSVPPLSNADIVCVPARDEADELVGMMFAQLLRQAGYSSTALTIGTVEHMLEQVAQGGYRIACVSALPPFAVGQARSLCKRLHARFPDLAIVVGLWGFSGGVPKAQERVGSNCTDAVATTLAEALLHVRRLSEFGADESGKSDNGVSLPGHVTGSRRHESTPILG